MKNKKITINKQSKKVSLFSLNNFINYYFVLAAIFIIFLFVQENMMKVTRSMEFYLNVLGIAFIILLFLHGIFTRKLRSILHKRYPFLYRDLIWFDLQYGVPILNYSKWLVFVWGNNKYKKEIKKLVYTIHIIEILIIIIIASFFIVAWNFTSKQ